MHEAPRRRGARTFAVAGRDENSGSNVFATATSRIIEVHVALSLWILGTSDPAARAASDGRGSPPAAVGVRCRGGGGGCADKIRSLR